jgi:anaerobic ribonucleoside-triphosphate reductase activating protein
VAALAHQIVGLKDIEGLTISGGEPLQQARALAILAAEVRARSRLSIILFTGFEPSEIQRMPVAQELLGHCDVLIAGRFHQEQAIATDLRGSSNKQIIFLTDRYTPHDFTGLFPAEIWISPDGSLSMSGISPVKL